MKHGFSKNTARKFSVKTTSASTPERASCFDLRGPRFSTILRGGSFRTIDPVTTPHGDYVQYGSFLRLSGAQCGGAISRRRYPSARFRHLRRRFRPLHLPRAEFRAARPAQAFPLGNSLSIPRAHRRKARSRRHYQPRFLFRCSRFLARSSRCLKVQRRASQRGCRRRGRRRPRYPSSLPPSQDRLILFTGTPIKPPRSCPLSARPPEKVPKYV